MLYWQPKITTDTLGKATVSFYTADYTGQIKVLVEAITGDGEIGYQELIFEVVKERRKNE